MKNVLGFISFKALFNYFEAVVSSSASKVSYGAAAGVCEAFEDFSEDEEEEE